MNKKTKLAILISTMLLGSSSLTHFAFAADDPLQEDSDIGSELNLEDDWLNLDWDNSWTESTWDAATSTWDSDTESSTTEENNSEEWNDNSDQEDPLENLDSSNQTNDNWGELENSGKTESQENLELENSELENENKLATESVDLNPQNPQEVDINISLKKDIFTTNDNSKVILTLKFYDPQTKQFETIDQIEQTNPDIANILKTLKIMKKENLIITDDMGNKIDTTNLTFTYPDKPGAPSFSEIPSDWLELYWLNIVLGNSQDFYGKELNIWIEATSNDINLINLVDYLKQKPIWGIQLVDWINSKKIIPITLSDPQIAWPMNDNQQPQPIQKPHQQIQQVKKVDTWVEDYLPLAILLIILSIIGQKYVMIKEDK